MNFNAMKSSRRCYRVHISIRAITRPLICSVILGFANLARLSAQDSDSDSSLWEKGSIQFGGFIATFNSDLTFGASGGGNASISAEDRLGLDSTLAVFRADAFYRPGKSRRNQIDFTYASYDRDGSATLSRELTIGDATYPIGAHIESVFDFDLIRGTYSYAFLQNDRWRVALGLGIYAVPLRYGVEVETDSGKSVVEGGDTTLPLPAVGLRAEVKLYSKLFFKTAVDGMYLEISDFRGSIIDLNVGLEYRAWKHVGFGLGYNFVNANVEGESTSDYPGIDFVGEVTVRFSGLLLYGKLSF
jgi:hypothetical protein